MSNLISESVTDEAKQLVLSAIETIKTNLPFLINLDPSQRQALPKIDDSRRPFVEKAINYGKSEPRIVPPFVDLPELENDLGLFDHLKDIARELNRVNEMVDDTTVAAGSDSYVAALSIYNAAKNASKMGVPGTDAIVADLAKHFEKNAQ